MNLAWLPDALSSALVPLFSAVPLIVMTLVLVLVFATLLVLASVIMRFGASLRSLSAPIYGKTMQEARKKAAQMLEETRSESRKEREGAQAQAQKILENAREEAKKVIENAKEESNKFSADRAAEDERLRAEQVKHVEEITTHAKELLNKQTSTIANLSEEIVIEFKKQSAAAQKILSDEADLIKQELSKVASDVHGDYQALMNTTKQKIEEDLTKEVEAARQAVRSYRQDRLALVNKEIVDLVEDTTRLALNKSLSLGEHRDIILSALDEAKKEGIFNETT